MGSNSLKLTGSNFENGVVMWMAEGGGKLNMANGVPILNGGNFS